ncbi:cyclic nucleotide-binding domain-containing protein (plasmid) [Shinella sp. H4-D48]|uniref:cyclic nucleotide-binding domain-containing protein n=1 Tax=Shinella sp. H4-D48 TaxID=2925841 RepID=UPI001F535ECE|nr:cyclic nucleotide-binding domain-containing protein [Shinella sp. H4-D48]UNK39983.1 cyclic nucleotide-binding domain-containing protein [Shinella sp. H4-D48]
MRKVLYILGQLDDEDIEWLVRKGRRFQPEPDTVLICEGIPVSELFFVLAGEVVVRVSGVGEVARLGRGEVVGEMSLIDSAPPSATVEAVAGALILGVDKRDIQVRLTENPGFGARFYKALAIFLADRLRNTTQRMNARTGLSAGVVMEDELDEGILDTLSLAGARFEHLLARLSGVAERGA